MHETALNGGFGRLQLAGFFARDGYQLVIVARAEAALSNTAAMPHKDHGSEAVAISKDLFQPKNAFEVYEEERAKGSMIDVLVNDEGQGVYGLFADADIRQLNIASFVSFTHLWAKNMPGRDGRKILNLSSAASKSPGPWQAVYYGTRAFVQLFTAALRCRLKEQEPTQIYRYAAGNF